VGVEGTDSGLAVRQGMQAVGGNLRQMAGELEAQNPRAGGPALVWARNQKELGWALERIQRVGSDGAGRNYRGPVCTEVAVRSQTVWLEVKVRSRKRSGNCIEAHDLIDTSSWKQADLARMGNRNWGRRRSCGTSHRSELGTERRQMLMHCRILSRRDIRG
jgi:hypothetical protein